MELTKKQSEGLRIAIARYRAGEKYTTISGYAGSGKSTLVKFIIEALEIDKEKVAYATFTGKAAEVLRRKGNDNAITLHKLLYDHLPKQNGGFYRIPKKSLEYKVVVVDEISLAPKSMLDMLLKHNVYCIFLGDSFQLPQIDKKEAHEFLDKPHIFLSEVMRQAAESEIIQLTMKIRNGEDIGYYQGKEVMVIPKAELVTGHYTWADMIITATNNTRHNVNNHVRQLLGYSGVLQSGEKVVIKRNYWDECNEDGDALVNGSVGVVENPFESFRRIPSFVKNNRRDLPIVIANFKPDGASEFNGIEFDKDFLLTENPCVDWKVAYQLGKLKNKIGDILPKQMTYGYSITCHAAQGSEWDKVLVIEETFPFDKLEHAKWIYTACTRASSKLVLIR